MITSIEIKHIKAEMGNPPLPIVKFNKKFADEFAITEYANSTNPRLAKELAAEKDYIKQLEAAAKDMPTKKKEKKA
ncbi:MAG: hypothetical protein ABL999_20345 [Pyrinomonadaceae bacterium]